MTSSANSDQLCCCITRRYHHLPCSFQELESSMKVFQSFAISMHTYHSFRLSVKLWYKCPSIRGSMLFISLHKHYPFPWIVPHTILPQLVLFSCLELDCPAEEVVKTYHLGNFHIQLLSILSSIYLPSLRPIPSPIYGIISQCLIDRIQVTFDSALSTS